MEYIVRQKFISFFHQRFEVVDRDENLKYTINSPSIFFKKHEITDFNGNLVGIVKKRYMRILARNDVLNADGKLQFIIKKKFTIFTKRFKVVDKTGAENKYTLNGDIFAWSFNLKRNDEIVAKYDKKVIAFTDTFYVNVLDDSVTLLAIGIAVALDNALRDKRQRISFFKG